MIYAAFSMWLFLALLAGTGVYCLWTRLARPGWVNWILLPGTIISEMAYIFGCLITGGEIRRAKLLPDTPNSKSKDDSEPATETNPRLKVIGPIASALLAIVACAAAVVVAHGLLGKSVTENFIGQAGMNALPKTLPSSWEGFWSLLSNQLELLKRMCETWFEINWTSWQAPLFVYLSICLSVRLAPAGRAMRNTLAAVLVIAAVIAAIGATSYKFGGLMESLWPLLTYIWSLLLFLLVVTLMVHGVVALAKSLSGRKPQ